MIRFTDNKRIIDGRTVTQIVQDGPIASNLVDVVEPNQLGGWIESKDSIPHTSWIDENVILFKEAYVGEYSVITATQPDTIISDMTFADGTVYKITDKHRFYSNVINIDGSKNDELPDMTAQAYKQKYFAFDTYGDPIDPNSAEKIYDPIYEKLKKRDKQNQVKKIVPTFMTTKQVEKATVETQTEPSRPGSQDTRNFLMRLAGESGTRRYKWMKRLETLALIVGLATILNMLVRIFLIR